MMNFTILVIASVLASGFALVPQTRPGLVDMATLPGTIDLGVEEPVIRPQPMPEVEVYNPCNACFEYMTALIDQLTVPGVDPVLPDLPTVVEPEAEDVDNLPIRPLPEGLPDDLRPLPIPESPDVEISPIPIPIVPDFRPLPLPVAPEVGFQPMPMPIAALV